MREDGDEYPTLKHGVRGERVRKRTVPWVADDAAYEAARGRTEG